MKISTIFKSDLKHNWWVLLLATILYVGSTTIMYMVDFSDPTTSVPSAVNQLYNVVVFTSPILTIVLWLYIFINAWRRDVRNKIVEKTRYQRSYHYYRIAYFICIVLYLDFISYMSTAYLANIPVWELLPNAADTLGIVFIFEKYVLLLACFYVPKYIYLYRSKSEGLLGVFLIVIIFSGIFAYGTLYGDYLWPTLATVMVTWALFALMHTLEMSNYKNTKKLPILEIVILAIVVVIGLTASIKTINYQYNYVTGGYQDGPVKEHPVDVIATEESDYGLATFGYNDMIGFSLTIEGDYNLNLTDPDGYYVIDVTDPRLEQYINFTVYSDIYEAPTASYTMSIVSSATSEEITYEECSNSYPRKEATTIAEISTMMEESCLSEEQAAELLPLIEYAIDLYEEYYTQEALNAR